MPDLFFYRDPEEADKEERERQEAAEAARCINLNNRFPFHLYDEPLI